MVERDIFLAALDAPDAATRAAYLDAVCDGDAVLRARVEALFQSHDAAGNFLDLPAVAERDTGITGAAGHARMDAAGTTEGGTGLGFLAPPRRPGSLGRIGHYEALEVIGRGGFGLVFRAFDDVLERVVAVKVLAPVLATTSPARKRFLREARSAAAIRHPNVVQIHAVEELPLPYLVMEFVPGETLQQAIDRTGPLGAPEVVRIGRRLAEGLAAAHAIGLVHRDVKPANILIESGVPREVKLTDFGLARAADDASITHSGEVIGTPHYMAPEQAHGASLDHRADLFSLGSVLYVMCTGRPPFRAGTTMAVLDRVRGDHPRPVREVIPETPEWLCRVIETLHVKHPAGRFQTAREVADVLAAGGRLLEGRPTPGDATLLAGRPRKTSRFRHRAAAVSLAAAAIAAAVCALSPADLWPGRRPAGTAGDAGRPGPDGADWTPLFNGRDLSGWVTHPSQTGGWGVEDGVLVGRGPEGYLFTRAADYDDFHLRVEARVSPGGNGGVYVRSRYGFFDLTRSVSVPFGYEVEITPPGGAGSPSRTGTIFRLTHQFQKAESTRPSPPPDTWLTLEVIVAGDRIETRVDGHEAAVYVDPQRAFARGRFALQAITPETAIRFRKIEVRRLKPVSAAGPTQSGPPLAIAPFSAAQARAYQKAWAAHLRVEPEITNSIGMKLRLIPPGEFQMGTPRDELRTVVDLARGGDALAHEVPGLEREWPPHEVRLTRPYYLGAHEVTYGQYRAFVRATGYKTEVERNGLGGWSTYRGEWVRRPVHVWSEPGEWQPGDDEPVVHMNWGDAQAFCAWLGAVEGRSYALPTEAQWEFACRAGAYGPHGAGGLADLRAGAWIRETQNGPETHRPHPVGLKLPNAFGLFDTLGNACEICADWYSGAPVGPAPQSDPVGPATGLAKVLRGGGWHRSGEVFARCSGRERTLNESGTDAGTGFRVAIVGDFWVRPVAPAPRPVP